MNMESFRINFRNKIYIPFTYKMRRKQIKNTSFTIISNNCWGGTVYESYGLPKQSPTIGMFIMPEDYLKFLGNLDYYLSHPLVLIRPEDSKWKGVLSHKHNWGTYLIGKLGDIELHLLHYHDEKAALDKWNRRINRIDKEHLIVKFNDQNGATKEDITAFLSLPYLHKLCFVSRKEINVEGTTYIPPESKEGIYASKEPFGNNRYININDIINSL